MSTKPQDAVVPATANEAVKSTLVSLEEDDEFEDFPVEGGLNSKQSV
jgi:hypothetical protein